MRQAVALRLNFLIAQSLVSTDKGCLMGGFPRTQLKKRFYLHWQFPLCEAFMVDKLDQAVDGIQICSDDFVVLNLNRILVFHKHHKFEYSGGIDNARIEK
jgi:hypothetical protein